MKDGYSITLHSALSLRHAVCLSNLHEISYWLLRRSLFRSVTFCGPLSLLNLEFRSNPPPLVEHTRDHPAHKDLDFN